MADITADRPKCSRDRNTYHLSKAEKQFYSKNGYFIIRKLFGQQALDSFKQRFQEICKNKPRNCSMIVDKKLASTSSDPEAYVNKIQDILNDGVFMRYSEDPCLLHVVSQLIGEELTALNCMLINKPPSSTRHPPHQDGYYFPIRPSTVVACWTAIDRATLQNGCVYVIPGSHTMDLLPHTPLEDSMKFFHGIVDETLAAEHARVYLQMEPGDTVFFPPYLVHGSEGNNSKSHRKAMTVHYMNSGCEFIDLRGTARDSLVRDFEAVVQNNGHPKSYHEWWKLKSKVPKNVQSHL